jgi:very-short-patch-repair endonuclease
MRGGLGGDVAVARLAELQYGVVSRSQLLALELSPTAIQGRLERGLAGYVYALLPRPRGRIQLSGHARCERPGMRVRRVAVDRSESRRCRGIPVTTPARTLVDLAGELDPLHLESLVEEAERRNLIRRRQLIAAAEAGGHRSGAARMRGLLRREQEPALTRSDTEKRMLRLVRAAELPQPDLNVLIGPYEVDMYWPEARLAVELDSYTFHGTRQAFEHDRARDAKLQSSGLPVLRFTRRQIRYQPELVLARLAQALASRPLPPPGPAAGRGRAGRPR